MPTISYFYGITIVMHPKGKEQFPRNGKRMVKEFILMNQDVLSEMWATGTYRRIEPLD